MGDLQDPLHRIGAKTHPRPNHEAIPGKETQVPNQHGNGPPRYGASLFASAPKAVGIEALVKTVAHVEGMVKMLSPKALDRMLAPDAVIAETANAVLSTLAAADQGLANADIEPLEATPYLSRLERAIGSLFTLGRQYHVPMRQAGLEEVFDLEDDLRLRLHYPGGRANRAELYYDENLEPPKHARVGENNLRDLAEPEPAEAHPVTRDDLITAIENIGRRVSGSITRAFEDAKQAIEEPSAPRNPDLLETLGEIAADIILSQANVALGRLLGTAAKLIDKKTGLSFKIGKYSTKQVGADMSRELLRGFREMGGDALKKGAGAMVKQLGKAQHHEHEDRDDDENLSARSIFLKHARESTVDRAIGVENRFETLQSEFKRLPVDALQNIMSAYDDHVVTAIHDDLYNMLVREWVNFAKRAAESGEDVRDEAHKPKHPSKLDNVLAPFGEVRIEIVLADSGTVRFRRATLPGVSDKVLDAIRRQEGTLAGAQLYRRIVISGGDAITPDLGAFTVDPKGTFAFERMSDMARAVVARLANPMFAADGQATRLGLTPHDGDLRAGFERILSKLVEPLQVIERSEQ